jgi:hypothetical protein
MANSTQLWWAGTITQFGDMQKFYDVNLWTMESKNGKYAGAWDLARKLAESHLLKREQLEQEGWVVA